MKNFKWKIEYSLAIIVLFTIGLFFVPISMESKEANYISEWNDAYNRVDYMFTAMSAQADSDIVKSLKKARTTERKEYLMIQLVKIYLRLDDLKHGRKYTPHFMNGSSVSPDNHLYFNNLYITKTGKIIGVKNIPNSSPSSPGFIMLLDMNGLKGPNTWGRDIFGINIYSSGQIKPIGYDWDIPALKKDCSKTGTGVSCSHYYRIGGEFTD